MIRIDELRRIYRYSQADIAKFLGTTNQTISNWENGKTEPDIASLIKLADLFKVSVDYLVGHKIKETSVRELRSRLRSSTKEELIDLVDDIIRTLDRK